MKKQAKQRAKRTAASGTKPVSTRIVVPKFATEAEEAEWWYRNRHVHGKLFHAAVKRGDAEILTREKLLARLDLWRER